MTETQLIQGCLEQNRTAQRQLYEQYKRAMYTLAYQMTGDYDQANDVLQDTFLDVFRYLSTFRQEATLGAWIKRILIRNAYKKVQKNDFRLVYQDEISDENSGTDFINENIDNQHLEELILALPESCRAVFVLIEVEGYAHREVAEMLNVSEGTSKSQLFYAKKKLKEMLSK